MGRRGPAPEPTALKILKGNPGKRPLNTDEPVVESSIPNPPAELSTAALAEWDRISVELFNAGLLSNIDLAGLAAYCSIYARWIEAEKHIQTTGMIIASPNGYPLVSPYLSIVNKCLQQMRGYLQEFGLSPSSRSRIKSSKAGEAGGDDEADEWSKMEKPNRRGAGAA